MAHTRSPGMLVLATLLILAMAVLAACGNGDDQDDGENNVDAAPDTTEEMQKSEDAPDPISVSADDLSLIEEWQSVGVPRFRDGEVLDFEPHASRVENGGTLLLNGEDATAEEIIGFYRGALRVLGWEERRASGRELAVQNDVASLLITATEYEDQTLIMMILTDRIGTEQAQN